MDSHGFAVIDFETTGLSAKTDRVIEIAVVHTDRLGQITGAWDTLVNPLRDLGRRPHRITARDLERAPTFAGVAPQLIELLRGRAIVAHNAPIGLRFLRAELERLDYEAPFLQLSTLCTMQLSKEFLPRSSKTLARCCAAYGIQLVNEHRARADATATAHLLSKYISAVPQAILWQDSLTRAAATVWDPLAYEPADWHTREDVPAH
jgi:DNA polymerase-3 subunit epsilon